MERYTYMVRQNLLDIHITDMVRYSINMVLYIHTERWVRYIINMVIYTERCALSLSHTKYTLS